VLFVKYRATAQATKEARQCNSNATEGRSKNGDDDIVEGEFSNFSIVKNDIV